MNKYQREIKPDVTVDVYDVLKAFNVTCPAVAHAVKKLLAPGKRGHKDQLTDLREAIVSIERAVELVDSYYTAELVGSPFETGIHYTVEDMPGTNHVKVAGIKMRHSKFKQYFKRL